jgi:superfamily II DNA/RNA helicase
MVVCTEETARGLDFPFLTHVILLNLPLEPNTYLHLAGRTGRNGRPGTVISFISESEMKRKASLERFLKVQFEEIKV